MYAEYANLVQECVQRFAFTRLKLFLRLRQKTCYCHFLM